MKTDPDQGYAAIVLYFRGGQTVAETIADLQAQTVPPSRIVLVDNASGDGIAECVRESFPDISLLQLSENLGYAGGMNAGAESLPASDWILFVTHEVRLDLDCMKQMLQVASTDPAVVQVGPRLQLNGSKKVWSSGGEITSLGGVRHVATQEITRTRDVTWLDGACLLVRRDDFVAVGGFNENYFLYWEDVDLSTRLQLRGRVVVAGEAIASQGTGTTPVYFMARNRLLFWLTARAPHKVMFALVVTLVKAARDVARKDTPLARARLHGLRDGFSGELHSEYFSIRERR